MIERRRTSLICLHDGKVLGFRAEDPTTGTPYFFLPGGKIEAGETAEEATLRETLEETGYRAQIVSGFRMEQEYPFRWDGKDYLSKTIFFAGQLKDPAAKPDLVEDAQYHKGMGWVAAEDVPEIFAYHQKIAFAVQAGIDFLKKRKI